jgi:hypothetical protein
MSHRIRTHIAYAHISYSSSCVHTYMYLHICILQKKNFGGSAVTSGRKDKGVKNAKRMS